MRKAQASTELMITIIFVITIMLPLLLITYLQTSNLSEQLSIQQAQQTVNKITNMADIVGSQGAPAKVTIQVFVAPNIANITLGNSTDGIGKEVIFSIRTTAGITQVVGITVNDIAGDLSTIIRPGTYFISLTAQQNCTKDQRKKCVYIERS
jgi:hypothetical protein